MGTIGRPKKKKARVNFVNCVFTRLGKEYCRYGKLKRKKEGVSRFLLGEKRFKRIEGGGHGKKKSGGCRSPPSASDSPLFMKG